MSKRVLNRLWLSIQRLTTSARVCLFASQGRSERIPFDRATATFVLMQRDRLAIGRA